MGLFGGNGENTRRNPDATFGFRALAAGYILYMLYEMIQMYIKGESELLILIIGIVVLGGGGVSILITSYLRWKREKAELAEELLRETEAQENAEEAEQEQDENE